MNRAALALGASVWLAVGGVASAGEVGVRGPLKVTDGRRVIGVLDLRIEGVDDDVKAAFQRDLADQLDSKQYRLTSWSEMQQALSRSTKWTDGCLVGPCLADARASTGAELVLLIALTGAGTSFSHAITLIRTDTGQIVSQDVDHCEVCTVNEATAHATLATLTLLNNLPDQLPATAAPLPYAPDPTAPERHHGLGVTLAIVGLSAFAIGGLLLATQDDHTPYAALTTGGAGLALGGLTILAF